MKPVISFDCKDESKNKIVVCKYLVDDVKTAEIQQGLDRKELSKLKNELGSLSGIEKVEKVSTLGDLADKWECGGKSVKPPFRVNYLRGLDAGELCNSINSNFVGFTGSDSAFPLGGSNKVQVERDFIEDLKESKNRCEKQLKKTTTTRPVCSDNVIKEKCLDALAGESGVKTATKILKTKFTD